MTSCGHQSTRAGTTVELATRSSATTLALVLGMDPAGSVTSPTTTSSAMFQMMTVPSPLDVARRFSSNGAQANEFTDLCAYVRTRARSVCVQGIAPVRYGDELLQREPVQVEHVDGHGRAVPEPVPGGVHRPGRLHPTSTRDQLLHLSSDAYILTGTVQRPPYELSLHTQHRAVPCQKAERASPSLIAGLTISCRLRRRPSRRPPEER